MRILICGGRDYADKEVVFSTLDDIHTQTPITSIIHGCAKGADTLGSDWCWARGIDEERFPADWNLYGRSAGPKRNVQMLETKPDLVVAFPGGRGTAHMVSISKEAGVEVKEIV